ncbi:hypothetical protein STSP1_01924 [Sedimentisphaera salicampi]|uniref:Uncharacterized protein n=1 Tax=Sedimentisphaera salicampi TaxID=1941349 RepID=A0A1W6LP47_9BACT|nr:hypothetical protein STSP1_01924 [Sedimentisphaera salicampi]OXU14376.1 hypothetical protein SMSP1_01840 [Sedimentisphaera salicampi]
MADSSNLNSHFREAMIETVPCSVFVMGAGRVRVLNYSSYTIVTIPSV